MINEMLNNRLGDVVLDLSDTAGIRDTQDRVEALGVARSLELLDRCDLILAVFDSSRPLDAVSLAAMRHVVYGDPKRLFSFSMNGESMALMARACEDFLLTQLDRGFRTLDFYKQLDMG